MRQLGELRQLLDGLEQLDVQVVPKRVDEHRHQRRLVAKVVDDERLVFAGLGGDALQGQAFVAVALEHPLRGHEDAQRSG